MVPAWPTMTTATLALLLAVSAVEPVAELSGLPESMLPEAIEARGGRTGQGA